MNEIFTPGPIVTLAFCLVAVTVLAVSVVLARGRRRRMQGAMPSSASPAVKRRIEQLGQPAARSQDPLGWSAEEVADRAAAPQDEAGEAAAALPGQGKTILIADDDAVVVFALSRRLQHLGYTVLRSPDALHALVGTMRARPDLVILDIDMPSGNGLAVCEMMASDPEFAATPVIIHSALADTATRLRAERLGAHHVEKSSHSWAEIRALVQSLLPPGGAVKKPAAGAVPLDNEAAVMPHIQRPRAAAEPVATAPAAAPATATSSTGTPAAPASLPARVLCIESPKDRLEMVEEQLAAIGVEVTRTSHLNEGYWTCFTEKFGLIVIHAAATDKDLPPLLHNLATHPVTRSLPVLWIKEGDAESEAPLPAMENLKVLKHPEDREDVLVELEKFLPLFGRRESELLAAAPAPAPKSAEATPRAQADSEKHVVQPVECKPLTILCVDDDPLVARAVALRLNPYGIVVTEADNGTSGYLRAASELPDLILLDLKMPNGEGNYVLGKLKDNARTKNIPVIVMTSETASSARRQMLSMGADAFVTKPVDWVALYTEMGRCVQLPHKLLQDHNLPEQLTLAQL